MVTVEKIFQVIKVEVTIGVVSKLEGYHQVSVLTRWSRAGDAIVIAFPAAVRIFQALVFNHVRFFQNTFRDLVLDRVVTSDNEFRGNKLACGWIKLSIFDEAIRLILYCGIEAFYRLRNSVKIRRRSNYNLLNTKGILVWLMRSPVAGISNSCTHQLGYCDSNNQ